MIVYVEYVVIDNLLIDYLLLKTALTLSGIEFKKIRVFLVALFGTGFALVFPLIDLSAFLLAAVKVGMGLLLILLSAKSLFPRSGRSKDMICRFTRTLIIRKPSIRQIYSICRKYTQIKTASVFTCANLTTMLQTIIHFSISVASIPALKYI